MSSTRLFTSSVKINSTLTPSLSGIILNSPSIPILLPNDTLFNNKKNNDQDKSLVGRINRPHNSTTGFTALILLILGILFFLFLCFIIGKCMGEEEDNRRSRKRPRKNRFSNPLRKKRPSYDNNKVLHQKRVYEIQAEEGCYSVPPSIDEVSDDKLIVPCPAPVEKTPPADDFPTPEIIISGGEVPSKNHDGNEQEKPKNKAIEALMKRKATTSDTPPALINVLKKKAMLKKAEIQQIES
uniref:Uncharacterized protein n=1 Tax=Strongyloides venezuelensis TaxID=75913 RepID=A0A0K0FEK6_STRVS